VAEFKEAYGQDFDEQIKNLAVEYEQTTDGNTEAYFTFINIFRKTSQNRFTRVSYISFSELVDFQPTNCPNIAKPSPYEQTTDGNTEAYFTLLTLAEGTVLLNGVKALVAKVGGTEALKVIAKETAMSIKDAGAFVNDLVRGRGFGNVRAIGRLKVNKLAEANITNSGKTVLGKHIEGGGYIKKAQDTGSSYFDIGNKRDKLITQAKMECKQTFFR
jgi:hypothetical protein